MTTHFAGVRDLPHVSSLSRQRIGLNQLSSHAILLTLHRLLGTSPKIPSAIETFLQSVAYPWLPFAILAALAFLTSILMLHLPETAFATLAETPEEAEEFGKDRSFFYVPAIEQYGMRKRAAAMAAATAMAAVATAAVGVNKREDVKQEKKEEEEKDSAI